MTASDQSGVSLTGELCCARGESNWGGLRCGGVDFMNFRKFVFREKCSLVDRSSLAGKMAARRWFRERSHTHTLFANERARDEGENTQACCLALARAVFLFLICVCVYGLMDFGVMFDVRFFFSSFYRKHNRVVNFDLTGSAELKEATQNGYVWSTTWWVPGRTGWSTPKRRIWRPGTVSFFVITVLCVCVSSVVCKRARASQREKESKW